MSPKEALKQRHIQINPPSVRFWLAFDIDRRDAAGAWDQADLPEPAWTAQNPENGHAHSVWGIEAPVLLDKPDRQKPVRYLAAIEQALKHKLGADVAYGGPTTKNPTHSHWRTFWGRFGVYGLDELADYVDLDRYKPHRGVNLDEVGLGRNCTLFEHVRQYAYRNLRFYNHDPRAFNQWHRAIFAEAQRRNFDFPEPLPTVEVGHVAKSIAGWTWRKFDVAASDRRFSEKQARRGKASGQKRRNASQERRERLMPLVATMARQGHSQQVIADTLGIGQKTVSRWLKGS